MNEVMHRRWLCGMEDPSQKDWKCAIVIAPTAVVGGALPCRAAPSLPEHVYADRSRRSTVSLRGAKRRSNPLPVGDCFGASLLAMTWWPGVSGQCQNDLRRRLHLARRGGLDHVR